MDNPSRVERIRVGEVVEAIHLEVGDVVADIGSGAGAFSVPMAQAIGPTGVLYAVDIDQAMIDHVVQRAEGEGLTNVRGVLGEYADPKLPTRDVDVAFLHDTLHMIELRQAYINALATYLKPDGRIVVIEREADQVENWMWLKRSDVDTWMAALSFYPVERPDFLGTQWFTIYQRPYGDSSLLSGNPGLP
jgi:ubiquinone/menaquinone biosynthesis C-methylase UbiE